MHINDLSTIIPHEQIIQTLEQFLSEYLGNQQHQQQIDGINRSTIIFLVRLVIEHQYILYENKLYQQIKGGSTNSTLMILLTNIYIYYWQQDLLRLLKKNNEIFGRYKSHILIFMYFPFPFIFNLDILMKYC